MAGPGGDRERGRWRAGGNYATWRCPSFFKMARDRLGVGEENACQQQIEKECSIRASKPALACRTSLQSMVQVQNDRLAPASDFTAPGITSSGYN